MVCFFEKNKYLEQDLKKNNFLLKNGSSNNRFVQEWLELSVRDEKQVATLEDFKDKAKDFLSY